VRYRTGLNPVAAKILEGMQGRAQEEIWARLVGLDDPCLSLWLGRLPRTPRESGGAVRAFSGLRLPPATPKGSAKVAGQLAVRAPGLIRN